MKAALIVESSCDAVDLNLGCPQNVAKRGRYGAFLEDWEIIFKIVQSLYQNLKVPVTCKFRVFDSTEQTCTFAKMLVDAGASVLSVHGRTREQKGPASGLADWKKISSIKVSSIRLLCHQYQYHFLPSRNYCHTFFLNENV